MISLNPMENTFADWRGWRNDGNGKQNAEHSPVHWDHQSGITWKKEIPGRGISSPILIDHKIFITTATEIEGQHPFRYILRFLMVITVFMMMWEAAKEYSSYCKRGKPGGIRCLLIKLNVFSLLYAVSMIILEMLTSPESLIHHEGLTFSSRPRMWIVSGFISASGIISCFMYAARSMRYRMILSLLAILISASFFVFVPNDNRVFPRNIGQYLGWGVALYGLITGVFSTQKYGWHLRVIGVLLAGIFSVYVVSLFFINTDYEELYAHHQYRFWLVTGFLGGVVLFAAGRSMVIKNGQDSYEKQGFSGIITAVILMLTATSQFYFINFLMPRQGLTREVLCYDEKSGEILWRRGFYTELREQVHNKNSHATPTPVTDGQAVYAYFGNAGMICVELDGKVRWTNKELPYHDMYGAASSPVVGHGKVFISCIDLESPYTIALNTENGNVAWKKPFVIEKNVGSYSTPWLGSYQGVSQLIINGGRKLISYAPDTGNILWSLDHEIGEVIPSSVVEGDWIIGGGDKNILSYKRIKTYQESTETKPELIWRTTKGAPFHCSMLIVQDQLISLSHQGVLTGLSLESQGKVLWQKRLPGNFTASPIMIGQHIYACSREGIVYVLKFENGKGLLIAENDLGELIEGTPAFSDGNLYIRTTTNLISIQGTGISD